MNSFFNQPQDVNLQGPVCHIKTGQNHKRFMVQCDILQIKTVSYLSNVKLKIL